MSGKTERYMKEIMQQRHRTDGPVVNLFAPVLPIPYEAQSFYLDRLIDEWLPTISGLAIYDADTILELPEALLPLPRMAFSSPANPLSLLHEISLGVDLFTLPFIGAATDAGVAFSFTFPPDPAATQKELGVDMWSSDHATSLAPLVHGCDCYACTKHHRAYIQHLLSAKEMLAWVLLQIHNIRVMDAFFAGVRSSIANGTFLVDSERFKNAYVADLPEGTGTGPRYARLIQSSKTLSY